MIIFNAMFGVDGFMNAQAIADCLTMLIAVPLLINILNFLKKREKEDAQGDEEETAGPEAIPEPFEN